MSSEIGDTPDSIALDLDVRAEHLANQGFEAAQFDNKKLVVSCAKKWMSLRRAGERNAR